MMHVKKSCTAAPCLRLSIAVSRRIDRKRGASRWRGCVGEMCCAGAFRVAWRETTPAVGTADNPAYYNNNKVRQEYLLFLALPSTKHSLQSGEKTWHLRSLPCASSSRLFSCRATKRRRLHQTKPHLPKRSARTRPSSPAQLVFTHPQPCSPPSTAATYCLNTAHTLSPDVYTSQPPKMEGSGSNQEQGLDNAIRALREKKQVPEIDFTIHEMEDGSQVNTQERVCKGE